MSRNLYNVVIRSICVSKQPKVPNQVRLYGRWMHRKPAKIMLPFEPTTNINLKKEKVIDLDPNTFSKSKETQDIIKENKVQKRKSKETQDNIQEKKVQNLEINKEKMKEIKQIKEIKLKKMNFYLSQKKVFDDNNEIIYEKLKYNDGRISTLFVKLKSKKERQRTQQILVEGWRMIVDGLEAKCTLKYIFFSRIEDLNKLRMFLPKTGVVIYKVPYKELEMWSDVETSPGIFGVFQMPTVDNIKRLSKPIPFQIVCDNIRVPGNLGGILRAAVGAGCEKVLLTKGCVDLWDSKVIRSASGAHFRQPIHTSLDWEEIHRLLPEDTSMYIADSNARIYDDPESEVNENIENYSDLPVVPYYSVDFAQSKHVTLIIGGETEGISGDSYGLAESLNGVRLNIPMQRGVDSLNTGMAAAVIAFEIRKQYIQYWTKLKLEKLAIPAA